MKMGDRYVQCHDRQDGRLSSRAASIQFEKTRAVGPMKRRKAGAHRKRAKVAFAELLLLLLLLWSPWLSIRYDEKRWLVVSSSSCAHFHSKSAVFLFFYRSYCALIPAIATSATRIFLSPHPNPPSWLYFPVGWAFDRSSWTVRTTKAIKSTSGAILSFFFYKKKTEEERPTHTLCSRHQDYIRRRRISM